MANLQNDIRQLFSHGVLSRFERLEGSNVNFTFNAPDIYLSCFDEALNRIEATGFQEYDDELATYARVFESFVKYPFETISPATAGIVSSALYWLAGYSGSSVLLAKAVNNNNEEHDYVTHQLLQFLSRDMFPITQQEFEQELSELLSDYIATGTEESFRDAVLVLDKYEREALEDYDIEAYVSSIIFQKVLSRFKSISIWACLAESTSASHESWQRYMRSQITLSVPLYDLWPSQRIAINKGLLDGRTSITLRMPTSAGKTKMTELAFVNDLMEDPERRCLYLAPFRALVAEVESSLGEVLPSLGFSIASLYGGSDANVIEAELAEISNVIVATPEKIEAVLSLAGKEITEFGTVVLDEGHLLDSMSRGANYEMQLADLREKLEECRTIFLSAVLPNSDDIACWLGGSVESLAQDEWQPTTMRSGVVVWPKNKVSQLVYVSGTGQQLTDNFFVHRILEEDSWQERNPETGRMRAHYFPRKNDNGTIAGALAFSYAKTGPVIIYASRPDWAESIAGKIIDRVNLEREIETNLVDDSNREELDALSNYLEKVLGEYSTLPQAVKNGFAYHHGKLPQSIRLVIEEEYRSQTIRLLIATNTLAQGVNLPARTIVVHSFPRTDAPIRDFWNLAGRAGRALKESEGEIIILGTGSLTANTVRKFLNKNGIEPIESRILSMVKKLVEDYDGVSLETIAEFVSDEDEDDRFTDVLTAIDMHMLGLLAEDLDENAQNELIEKIASNLLATYQAEKEDLLNETDYSSSVKDLVSSRRSYIFNSVPEASKRSRFSASGIDIGSCFLFEESEIEIIEFLAEYAEFSEDAFSELIDYVEDFSELNGVDVNLLKSIGFMWCNQASYSEIYEAHIDDFSSFNNLIKFIEDAVCYRTTWAISGFVRLVDSIEIEVELVVPSWLKDFPQLLRYGVSTKEMMWVMSLGVSDRDVASWLLNLYNENNRLPPRSIKRFVNWSIQNRVMIINAMSNEWPIYFSKLFDGILNRYEKIQDALS